MISPKIIEADIRMGFDHGQNRVFCQCGDRVPVKEVPRDQNSLHAVSGGISCKALEVPQQFIPPAFRAIPVQMRM